MKKFITLLAVTASLAVLAPATSQAFDGHASSRNFANNCGSCGTPVYHERAITGYDRHRNPVYGYRTASHNCRPSNGHGSGNRFGHGSNHGGNSGGHFGPSGFQFNFGGRSSGH
ncbi:MAG: hypothetical protein WAW39_08680 [Prosthecobacter sp.]|uniref:hypothetical protein n=1 Tax=Prosthecobacter sp. TaxID=1965333 RepID=UPI003BB1C219